MGLCGPAVTMVVITERNTMAAAALGGAPLAASRGWHQPRWMGRLVANCFLSWSGTHELQPSSGLWRSELLQQHRQGFTQLEPVAGGVCEEESALRNKASILD